MIDPAPRLWWAPRTRWGALIVATATGCGTATPPLEGFEHAVATKSSPPLLCRDPTLAEDSFCVPPPAVAGLLRSAPLTFLSLEAAGIGTSGAMKARIVVATDGVGTDGAPLVMDVKLKLLPAEGEAYNNAPRKELAAYHLQQLFSDPREQVVPPTVVRCIEHSALGGLVEQGMELPLSHFFADLPCTTVLLAVWLDRVTSFGVLDATLCGADPACERSMAQFNLLTHLADHRDSNRYNFLRSTDPRRPRWVSIDNSLAFSGIANPLPKIFGGDWAELRVPSIPRDAFERLRRLSPEDYYGALAVVSELRRGEDGYLHDVAPSPPLALDRGVRQRGDTVQFGLTQGEIEGVIRRGRSIVGAVVRGELSLR